METARQTTSWDLWAEFCNKTGREANWGRKIGSELQQRGVLPCRLALDVGCGTGEFTEAILQFTTRVEGIDVVDTRKSHAFKFRLLGFEAFGGEEPDVLLFKQSYHLLDDPDSAAKRFPRSTLVIAQMPQPQWDSNPDWAKRPLNAQLNAEVLRNTGRATEVVRMEQTYAIEMPLLTRMFLDGYTSDLRKLSAEERAVIWEKLRPRYENGAPFVDTLDVIIASPSEQ
jgi:hypothetical protein